MKFWLRDLKALPNTYGADCTISSGCGLREHHTPNCFSTLNQLKKPMEVGRCACITALLQLEDCSLQGCQILAAAQEILA